MAETGLYCYAIGSGIEVSWLSEEPGIGDLPLRVVRHEDLTAVLSEVDLAEFGEDGLRQNLEDLAWLESVALAHDRVVRMLADRAPIAPLRLATIFLSEDGVRARLVETAAEVRRALDQVRGAREWSVKVYVDPAAEDAPVGEQASAAPAAGPGAGRAYLLGRREAARSRDRSAEAGRRVAETVHEQVAAISTDHQRLAPQDRQLTGHVGEMVLNGAYLVPDERREELWSLVEKLDEEHAGARVEASGPWAPYSFAQLGAS